MLIIWKNQLNVRNATNRTLCEFTSFKCEHNLKPALMSKYKSSKNNEEEEEVEGEGE